MEADKIEREERGTNRLTRGMVETTMCSSRPPASLAGASLDATSLAPCAPAAWPSSQLRCVRIERCNHRTQKVRQRHVEWKD